MSYDEPAPRWRTPGPGAALALALAASVASSGGAAYLTWRQHRLVASRAIEACDLIHALSGSASAADTRRIRVAVFHDVTSRAPPDHLARILGSDPTWVWRLVGPADVRAGALEHFDVAIFPGDRWGRPVVTLGNKGKQAVRQYVRRGGGYVGLCGGASLATARHLGLINVRAMTGETSLPGPRPRPATVRMELTDAGRMVLGDVPGLIDVEFTGGPIFSGSDSRLPPPFVPLACYRSEAFAGQPRRGTMTHTPSVIAARFGEGRVLAISPHVEITKALEPLMKRAILATARKPDGRNAPAAEPGADPSGHL